MSQDLPFSSGCAVTPHTPKHGVRIPGSHNCNSLQPVGTFQSGGGATVQHVHQSVGERGTTMTVVGVDGSHNRILPMQPLRHPKNPTTNVSGVEAFPGCAPAQAVTVADLRSV